MGKYYFNLLVLNHLKRVSGLTVLITDGTMWACCAISPSICCIYDVNLFPCSTPNPIKYKGKIVEFPFRDRLFGTKIKVVISYTTELSDYMSHNYLHKIISLTCHNLS